MIALDLCRLIFMICPSSLSCAKAKIMVHILIKITQNHYLDTTFLQNRTTDFDETLHVAWVCLCEGFGNSGRSGYGPLQMKSGRSLASLLNYSSN